MKPRSTAKIKESLAVFLILAIVLLAGFYLRTAYRSDTVPFNTAGFYYYRAYYLDTYGEYIKTETKSVYPYSYQENYPPFLALFSVLLYKLSMSNDLLAFMSWFPVIVYISTLTLGYLAATRLFGKTTGLFFAVLFSIVPTAVDVTAKGAYTEEPLGMLLLIGFIYCLAKLKDDVKYLYLGKTGRWKQQPCVRVPQP